MNKSYYVDRVTTRSSVLPMFVIDQLTFKRKEDKMRILLGMLFICCLCFSASSQKADAEVFNTNDTVCSTNVSLQGDYALMSTVIEFDNHQPMIEIQKEFYVFRAVILEKQYTTKKKYILIDKNVEREHYNIHATESFKNGYIGKSWSWNGPVHQWITA